MLPNFFDRSKLPRKSGVYIFKDKGNCILYVGKAVDLYHRVASYFSDTKRARSKISALVERITTVETIVVESELEALILEANLIKKYRPSFNIRLTDDRDYLYIAITKEFFPKVITARKPDLEKAKKYWGPFPSARNVRDTLKHLRKVFPWCSGRGPRPCFYYHLGQCLGACAGLISRKEYSKIINRFSMLLDGKKEKLVSELTLDMMRLSDKRKFEDAAKIKKMIQGIEYLTQQNRTEMYLQNPNFLQEEKQLALKQLQKDLNLPKLPKRIEGYDISNIAGQEAVGSMVVLTDGEVDKSQYRQFKMHPQASVPAKANDVGMMRDMIKRRLRHLDWPKPDLILVDGGRGQVRAVKLEMPVFGLAKRMEWLYPPEGDIIKLSRKSLSLRLLQKLRDEAHRFAVSYHRKLHKKMFFN